jgi:hypothetical protein
MLGGEATAFLFTGATGYGLGEAEEDDDETKAAVPVLDWSYLLCAIKRGLSALSRLL